jgi:hypothetical protein
VLVAGALLAPAASASASHRRAANIDLARVPLQTEQLGPAGASFALIYGSGEIPNFETTLSLIPPNPYIFNFGGTNFARLGRIDGYALDYGDEFTGSTGVMEIRSGVEEYRNPADARKGLHAWQKQDAEAGRVYSSPLVPITVSRFKSPGVGKFRFTDLITLAAPNLNPIVKLDEQVTYGKYVLDLTVTAGSVSSAEHAAPHLLRVLRNRLRRLLGGHRVAGGPVNLPPQPPFGPAPGGPALSMLNLQPPDVGQPYPVYVFQGYTVEPPALSAYYMDISPAGQYDDLQQVIGWWPTPTEATYGETYESAFFFASGVVVGSARRAESGSGVTVTPVDLSAVGDGATGYIITGFGAPSQASITLTNGQAGESITAVSSSTLQASDVQSLAQAAANRLDAGLGP